MRNRINLNRTGDLYVRMRGCRRSCQRTGSGSTCPIPGTRWTVMTETEAMHGESAGMPGVFVRRSSRWKAGGFMWKSRQQGSRLLYM